MLHSATGNRRQDHTRIQGPLSYAECQYVNCESIDRCRDRSLEADLVLVAYWPQCVVSIASYQDNRVVLCSRSSRAREQRRSDLVLLLGRSLSCQPIVAGPPTSNCLDSVHLAGQGQCNSLLLILQPRHGNRRELETREQGKLEAKEREKLETAGIGNVE